MPPPPIPAPQLASSPSPALRTKLLWIAALYFSSGFPFGLINYSLPVYLRTGGASLPLIGRLVSDVGAAWTFKFLWSPLVDRIGTRKAWILSCQVGLAVLTVGLALTDPARATPYLWVLLITLAALSATQDIAIDAYTIELLDQREMGIANGVRVTAYRVALLVTSGTLLSLVRPLGWSRVWVVGAAALLLVAAITLTLPSTRRAPRGQAITEPLVALFRRPLLPVVVLFALTFKLGDLAMQPMTAPFAVDRGLTTDQLGLLGYVSIASVIAGALLGGVLTSRWGIFRALWTLGLVQALSNLGYFAAAAPGAPRGTVFAAGALEQLTGGLGTAAFLAFLMSLCDKRYAATQYAFLSALFGASRWIAGRYSGDMVQAMGYQRYFLLTFVLAFPAFLLLPLVRRVRPAADEAAEPAAA
ncbi:MAG: MFS transporter [Gemmatimonadaceae bacterium]